MCRKGDITLLTALKVRKPSCRATQMPTSFVPYLQQDARVDKRRLNAVPWKRWGLLRRGLIQSYPVTLQGTSKYLTSNDIAGAVEVSPHEQVLVAFSVLLVPESDGSICATFRLVILPALMMAENKNKVRSIEPGRDRSVALGEASSIEKRVTFLHKLCGHAH